MEITGKNSPICLEAYARTSRSRGKAQNGSLPATSEGMGEDRVDLSPEAKNIQEAEKILSGIPDVREDKVAELKHRIETGDYEVDGEKAALRMAFKMIKEALINNELV